jgi:16S rRNA processing protein RimM
VRAWDDFVLVGRIARPQGHRGEVVVNPETDFIEERFAAGARVWMLRDGQPAAVTILGAWVHKGRPVLRLEGVATMNDAERLRDVELRVPADSLRTLPEGSYYEHDLIGCVVTTTDGRVVGPVRDVERGAGALRLVIGQGRDEVQVPFVEAICVEVDVAGRRIVVDPPEGLLDVNASRA